MSKFILLLLFATSAFGQWGPIPTNFTAVYGFSIKGAEVWEGSLLRWNPVTGADGYIVSWTQNTNEWSYNPTVWGDIAFTFDPEFFDIATRPKDFAQRWRVRSVFWEGPPTEGFPTPWQTPILTTYLPSWSLAETNKVALRLFGRDYPSFTVITAAGKPRVAVLETTCILPGTWTTYAAEALENRQFFRLKVQ